MNNDNKVETAIAGVNFWASYASVATSNTFAYDQLKPCVWWNFPRHACFCRETGDFTGFRFVACQDFEAIDL